MKLPEQALIQASQVTPARGRRHWLLWLLALLGLSLLALGWGSNAFWNALSPVTHKRELYALAGQYHIDPLLLSALILAESSYNPVAQSKKGALGLMQLLPSTAEEIARELKLNYQDRDDLYTESVNLQLGTFHLARLLKAFGGDLVLALAAYNAGTANVKAWGLSSWGQDQEQRIEAIPVAETRAYVSRVFFYYRLLKRWQAVKRFLNGDPQP